MFCSRDLAYDLYSVHITTWLSVCTLLCQVSIHFTHVRMKCTCVGRVGMPCMHWVWQSTGEYSIPSV